MGKTFTLSIGGIFAATLVQAATLSEFDANADGMVTYDEMLTVAPDTSEDVFRLADTNEDGMIDAEEFALAQETGLLPAS